MMKLIIPMAVLFCATAASGQEVDEKTSKPGETAHTQNRAGSAEARVPLRLQFLITRYQGEKKVSSRPYAVFLYAHPQSENRTDGFLDRAELFLGTQVPFRVAIKDGPPTVVLKNVGVKVSANATAMGHGRYRIPVQFDESFVFVLPEGTNAPRAIGADEGGPMLRSLNASAVLFLLDGESLTYAAGVDPVTGDSVKVEATLNVLK